MKMTAVVIKFSNSVFLVKTDYLQTTAVLHLKEKTTTKKTLLFYLMKNLQGKLLSFQVYVLFF